MGNSSPKFENQFEKIDDEKKNELKSIFDKVDKNKDELISRRELSSALKKTVGSGMKKEEFKEMIDEIFISFDTNKDGKLDYEELKNSFVLYLTTNPDEHGVKILT